MYVLKCRVYLNRNKLFVITENININFLIWQLQLKSIKSSARNAQRNAQSFV